jgi:hypothetical protein
LPEDQSVTNEAGVVIVGGATLNAKRKPQQSLATTETLGKEELRCQRGDILKDRENIQVKRVVLFIHYLDWQTNELSSVDLVEYHTNSGVSTLSFSKRQSGSNLQSTTNTSDVSSQVHMQVSTRSHMGELPQPVGVKQKPLQHSFSPHIRVCIENHRNRSVNLLVSPMRFFSVVVDF